ncbi:hypothetical protein ACIRFH_25620 [Streptomyces sp. NPDC093586]|uniref:hypothetical protein n=1 Tax=Streptomyces sp. NPDC093586 TaxID=3366042 RepID=UPI003815D4FE
MWSKLPESARSAVAVSVAALITAAALFGSLAPGITAPPAVGVEPSAATGAAVEGTLLDRLAPR